jgi:hypothetical protein
MGPLVRLVGFTFIWLLLIGITAGVGLILFVPYWLLTFRGQEVRAAKANEKLRAAIMDGETIVQSALQLRIAALSTRRQTLAVTSSRIIVVSRSMFGGFAMKDYQWKDLGDAQLSENVLPQWFGTKLHFSVANGTLEIDGIPSDVASKIYKHSQHQEQAWEEKRRVRKLEEMRAAAGGIVMNGGITSANDGRVGSSLDELERAKKLLDSGVVSDAEYQEIKAKILSRAS